MKEFNLSGQISLILVEIFLYCIIFKKIPSFFQKEILIICFDCILMFIFDICNYVY